MVRFKGFEPKNNNKFQAKSRLLRPESSKKIMSTTMATRGKICPSTKATQVPPMQFYSLIFLVYFSLTILLNVATQQQAPSDIRDSAHHFNGLVNYSIHVDPISMVNQTKNTTFSQNDIPDMPSNDVESTSIDSKENQTTKENQTSTSDSDDSSSDENLVQVIKITNSIICAIGISGNLIVILVILKFTRVETVTDIYILNLAFADLTFVAGLIFLVTTMNTGDWIFGSIMCKVFMSLTSLNQFASSLLLVVMSFDRFLAVCHPIYAQRFRQAKRAKMICTCIWIICLVLMTPILIFAKTGDEMNCGIFWPEYEGFNCEMAFTMYSFTIGFALPLTLIAGFYFRVVHRLRKAALPENLKSTRRSKNRETTNRRIENLVIGIICTYTVCWLPYWVTQISVSVRQNQSPSFYSLVLIGTSLSYTNSALNPILYAFLSDNFKRRCADIFRSLRALKWCKIPLMPSVDSNSNLSARYPTSQQQTTVTNARKLPLEHSTDITLPEFMDMPMQYKDNNSHSPNTQTTRVRCYTEPCSQNAVDDTVPIGPSSNVVHESSMEINGDSKEVKQNCSSNVSFSVMNIVAPEIVGGSFPGTKKSSFKLHSCFKGPHKESQGV